MSPKAGDNMLPTASWFHRADRSLMRFYGGHNDGAFLCPPGPAGQNVSISIGHARRRTKVLADAGMLERAGASYRITDLGLRYVDGDMSQDELESLNPDANE